MHVHFIHSQRGVVYEPTYYYHQEVPVIHDPSQCPCVAALVVLYCQL
jgi:hypothetical protein